MLMSVFIDFDEVSGYEIVGWNGLFVPSGTPRNIVAHLHSETAKALVQPDVKERLATMGAEGVGSSPEEFGAFVKAEIRKWAKVVKEAGLKVE